jgi:hypothetical protein
MRSRQASSDPPSVLAARLAAVAEIGNLFDTFLPRCGRRHHHRDAIAALAGKKRRAIAEAPGCGIATVASRRGRRERVAIPFRRGKPPPGDVLTQRQLTRGSGAHLRWCGAPCVMADRVARIARSIGSAVQLQTEIDRCLRAGSQLGTVVA